MAEAEEKLIKTLDRGVGQQLRIRLVTFHGREYLDLRNFYCARHGSRGLDQTSKASSDKLGSVQLSSVRLAQSLPPSVRAKMAFWRWRRFSA